MRGGGGGGDIELLAYIASILCMVVFKITLAYFVKADAPHGRCSRQQFASC